MSIAQATSRSTRRNTGRAARASVQRGSPPSRRSWAATCGSGGLGPPRPRPRHGRCRPPCAGPRPAGDRRCGGSGRWSGPRPPRRRRGPGSARHCHRGAGRRRRCRRPCRLLRRLDGPAGRRSAPPRLSSRPGKGGRRSSSRPRRGRRRLSSRWGLGRPLTIRRRSGRRPARRRRMAHRRGPRRRAARRRARSSPSAGSTDDGASAGAPTCAGASKSSLGAPAPARRVPGVASFPSTGHHPATLGRVVLTALDHTPRKRGLLPDRHGRALRGSVSSSSSRDGRGDVVLELVARPEPQLAVGALVYVGHAIQRRAATFPAG